MVTYRFSAPGAEAIVTPIAIMAAIIQLYPIKTPANSTKTPIEIAKMVMIFTYLEISFSMDVTFLSAV